MEAKSQVHTVASLISEGIQNLDASNIKDARRNVEWMLCELLNCNRAVLYGYPEKKVPETLRSEFMKMIRRRNRHEPLQYILGHTSFYGLRIDVSPAVLIPRPETEQVFEKARFFLRGLSSPRVLDLCTGSGCLPIVFHHVYPQAEIYACDISTEALETARKNAVKHEAEVNFFQCDILAKDVYLPTNSPFDIIVSNPPYIPAAEFAGLDPEVNQHEPEMALNAGEDPLMFYRAIAKKAGMWLKPDGALVFEIHCDFAESMVNLMREYEFSDVTIDADLTGRPRIASGIWRTR